MKADSMSTLQILREAAGLSQDALAELIGTTQPQIQRLEKGARPITIKWAKLLAPRLGCKPLDLLPIDVNETNSTISSKNTEQALDKSAYSELRSVAHQPVGKDTEEAMIPDAVLTTIGRLTVEMEGLKAEIRELKVAVRGSANPKKARRK